MMIYYNWWFFSSTFFLGTQLFLSENAHGKDNTLGYPNSVMEKSWSSCDAKCSVTMFVRVHVCMCVCMFEILGLSFFFNVTKMK